MLIDCLIDCLRTLTRLLLAVVGMVVVFVLVGKERWTLLRENGTSRRRSFHIGEIQGERAREKAMSPINDMDRG